MALSAVITAMGGRFDGLIVTATLVKTAPLVTVMVTAPGAVPFNVTTPLVLTPTT
jgi:hypothetical protein